MAQGRAELYVIRNVKTGLYWRNKEARGLAGCWVMNRMIATTYTFPALQAETFPEGGVARDYWTDEPVRVGKTVTDLESLVEKTEQEHGSLCDSCTHSDNCRLSVIRLPEARVLECEAFVPISLTKAPREVPGLLGSDAYNSRILPIDNPSDWVPTWSDLDWLQLQAWGVARD